MPVALDVCADPLPDDVATTAYYVASEALTNAVKHASPASIGLRVARLGRPADRAGQRRRRAAVPWSGRAPGWPAWPTGSPRPAGCCR